MSHAPTVLLHDEDQTRAAAISGVLSKSGFLSRFVTDRQKILAAARLLKPVLLVVAAELRSDAVRDILSALGNDVAQSHLPMALICRATDEGRFMSSLRTGIVALLPAPFTAQMHPHLLSDLIEELPGRSGILSGKGDSTELVALVEHLRRTQRSGVLRTADKTLDQGEALIGRGTLKSARYKGFRDAEALAKMVTVSSAPFTFTEVGNDADVVIPVEEVLLEDPAAAVTGPTRPVEEAKAGPVVEPSTPLLLVDDDESLCRMFSLLFTKHGYDVALAHDGAEGFELARKRDFAAVVADLNMPKLDGWGMLRLLRDDYRTRELPLAFLSCHDDYRDSLKALDAGAQAYYPKSTRLDALARQVGELLEPRAKARRALTEALPFEVGFGLIGPQWFLRAGLKAHVSGVLHAKDSWARYELWLSQGQPVHAAAFSGPHRAEGQRAFNAFIASRNAEGMFTPNVSVQEGTLGAPLEELLENAVATLNANEARLKDGLLVNAKEIHVNPELYALYAQVGPKQWLEVARLLCEEKVPPRDVLDRMEISPVEVEETLRDLVRRGVIRLSA